MEEENKWTELFTTRVLPDVIANPRKIRLRRCICWTQGVGPRRAGDVPGDFECRGHDGGVDRAFALSELPAVVGGREPREGQPIRGKALATS